MTGPLLVRGDARNLPLPDACVDSIITSPPYFALRSYSDNGEHMAGQLGDEPTPAEFVDSLIACTREMMRVLKPTGSIFVNLGDTYSAGFGSTPRDTVGSSDGLTGRAARGRRRKVAVPAKSLMLIPERYRIACVDELGLVARAVIVWSKPNGMPESVTDRVRRSHEDWVHLTKSPRYFASVDEIREQYSERTQDRQSYAGRDVAPSSTWASDAGRQDGGNNRGILGFGHQGANPLGKLPGSVWTIPTQPLQVPADVEVDHFAAFPMEWPRRLIQGWCPRDVCTVCGEGRRPVVDNVAMTIRPSARRLAAQASGSAQRIATGATAHPAARTITGYACACPDATAPTTPGVVLDPFSGTGTTALVATMLGRIGIGVDLSADYNRLARWRTTDPKERARAAGFEAAVVSKIVRPMRDQLDLFGEA